MKRSRILKALGVALALPLLYLADIAPDAGVGLTLGRDAHAIAGAPATAQQQQATAQQQAAAAQQQADAARPPGAPAAGAVVNALPAGCKPATKSGVECQNGGGVCCRAAFQDKNLVYGVQ